MIAKTVDASEAVGPYVWCGEGTPPPDIVAMERALERFSARVAADVPASFVPDADWAQRQVDPPRMVPSDSQISSRARGWPLAAAAGFVLMLGGVTLFRTAGVDGEDAVALQTDPSGDEGPVILEEPTVVAVETDRPDVAIAAPPKPAKPKTKPKKKGKPKKKAQPGEKAKPKKPKKKAQPGEKAKPKKPKKKARPGAKAKPAKRKTKAKSKSKHMTVVRDTVRRGLDDVRHCYNQGLVRNPSLAGRVAVQFIIAPSGSVQSATLAGTGLGDAGVDTCIVRVFERMTFAIDADHEVAVTYPIAFQPTS